ncbi:hypothetical protein C0Q70_09885 [Pomacea canaliculata]|uniref:Uncharacterized protein n=1 Tax=Pomacea canaliculata TaxID=400727 RepID=A0A2T7PB31_POMCA|nr:hypothetical protein C0Q70_09885 [Pomacea canaliculata]
MSVSESQRCLGYLSSVTYLRSVHSQSRWPPGSNPLGVDTCHRHIVGSIVLLMHRSAGTRHVSACLTPVHGTRCDLHHQTTSGCRKPKVLSRSSLQPPRHPMKSRTKAACRQPWDARAAPAAATAWPLFNGDYQLRQSL